MNQRKANPITPIKYYALTKTPLLRIDGHFSVISCWTKYKLKFLTGTDDGHFYKDLEEIIATMEHENENFEKHTFLKSIVKNPYDSVLGTFAQIRVDCKLICSVYELKGEHELMKINIDDLVNKSFEGSCTVQVYGSYQDSCKSTILFIEEILVRGPTSPRKVVCDLLSEEESSSGVSEGESSEED